MHFTLLILFAQISGLNPWQLPPWRRDANLCM